MPMNMTLPRGCASIRGSSDARSDRALGGQTAKYANRLYMLTVRRESLLNKQRSLEHRLEDIRKQVKNIESELRGVNGKYRTQLSATAGRKTCLPARQEGRSFGNGRDLKTSNMSLSY